MRQFRQFRPHLKRAPSKVAVRNTVKGLTALYTGAECEPMEPQRASHKTGRQKEAPIDKTIGQWGQSKGGELHKNRKGMVTLPGGGMFPYGWGPPGTLDRLGWLPVLITQAMVGKTLPIHTEIDAKTDEGRVQENQQKRIDYLRDHNAIAGIASGAGAVEDCEAIYQRWWQAVTRGQT